MMVAQTSSQRTSPVTRDSETYDVKKEQEGTLCKPDKNRIAMKNFSL